ncbi:MAG: cyclase family protein [Erysipelothrix sp.]|nr:cyclase family protein [Erysipelothrix sp.]
MKVIDLSQSIYTEMEVYPNDPPVKIDIVHSYETDHWQLRSLQMGSHTGSHVDAFSHMHKNMANLDQIPLERFFGMAQLVKLDQEWPKDIGLFFVETIDIDYLDKIISFNPGFVGGNISDSLEKELLKREIITYTGLVNLDLLPVLESFMFYGLPLKIKEGDGSPVRAIAII